MGAATSRSQVTPVVVESWTKEQLSEAIKELGPAYEAYGQACVENGITGEVLLQTDEAELPEVLQDLGVKIMHRTVLKLEVKKLKEGSDAAEAGPSSSEGFLSTTVELSGSQQRGRRRLRRDAAELMKQWELQSDELEFDRTKPLFQGGQADVYRGESDLLLVSDRK